MTKHGIKFTRSCISTTSAPSGTGVYATEENVNNGFRPHGGYRGKPEHLQTFTEFRRSQDFDSQPEPDEFDHADTNNVSSIRNELRTPEYVHEYMKGVPYSDEFPLFSHKLLAVSKMESGGYLTFSRELLRPTKCNSPMRDSSGLTYYRPNPTHQYLSATDLKDCTANEINIQHGKPTRTTLLRARQRCYSAPPKRQTPSRQTDQERTEREQRPLSARNYSGVPGMVRRVPTGGDSYRAFIVGARYNRAHCIDSRTLTKYGTYVSRSNPANCFSLQKPVPEPEINFDDIRAGGINTVSPATISSGKSPSSEKTLSPGQVSPSEDSTNARQSVVCSPKRKQTRQTKPSEASSRSQRTPRGNFPGAFASDTKYMSMTFYRNSPKPITTLNIAGAVFPGGVRSPTIKRSIVKGDHAPGGPSKLTVKDVSAKLQEENANVPVLPPFKKFDYQPEVNDEILTGIPLVGETVPDERHPTSPTEEPNPSPCMNKDRTVAIESRPQPDACGIRDEVQVLDDCENNDAMGVSITNGSLKEMDTNVDNEDRVDMMSEPISATQPQKSVGFFVTENDKRDSSEPLDERPVLLNGESDENSAVKSAACHDSSQDDVRVDGDYGAKQDFLIDISAEENAGSHNDDSAPLKIDIDLTAEQFETLSP